MKPNIFLHYWNQEGQTLSFQEVLSLDCDPMILATIQAELLQQLTSEAIVEKLPNFDWSNLRMQEKWNSIAQTLLMQVQLPEQIWLDWQQKNLMQLAWKPIGVDQAAQRIFQFLEPLQTANAQ